jgi:collagenase-like PrtC family protease
VKLAAGYQLAEEDEEPLVDIVRDYREQVAEVYFPWLDMPSGRAPLTSRRGYVDWSAQERLEADLREFRGMGVRLDLLFNAACYGRHAASRHLENRVVSVLDHLGEVAGGVDAVTTTSLAVARTVKRSFPEVEVRASVNMRIGTAEAMRYVAGLFDGYHVARELNRDLAALRGLKQWADGAGKGLHLLANSGCVAHCPGQTFHDNLVAHEAEADETAAIEGWNPHVCWSLFEDRANWPAVLRETWIRPEDLHHYEGLFPVVKLATRMHARPRAVIAAYAERRHRGNLLDLFEPGHGPLFAPFILDNERFPDDWFERTSTCERECRRCGYCAGVLDQVLVQVTGGDAVRQAEPRVRRVPARA